MVAAEVSWTLPLRHSPPPPVEEEDEERRRWGGGMGGGSINWSLERAAASQATPTPVSFGATEQGGSKLNYVLVW